MMDQITRNDRESRALFERASRTLVGGVNSPARSFQAVGGQPVFIERAHGAHIYDVDGNSYIDLIGSWGPAIVGHSHPTVVRAVSEAAARGLSFGACCRAESELAELIVGAFDGMDMIRFINSGTEATMSALRLARGATGRSKVIKFAGCYHGHVDSLLVSAGSGAMTHGQPDSAGVPDAFASTTLVAPYNDVDAVRALMTHDGRNVAAVIVEPLAGNMGMVEPDVGFLASLRDACDENGCLLIFDEVMTGFRVAWGGYQAICGVRPDITCLGKIIGGGMPVGAYGASRSLMENVSPLGRVYQAGTLSGNPVAMAAGLSTLRLCERSGFYDELGLASSRLVVGLREAASEFSAPLQMAACGGLLGLAFRDQPVRNLADAQRCDHEMYARFFRAMLDRGVMLPPSGYEAQFISAAHDDQVVDQVIDRARTAFGSITK